VFLLHRPTQTRIDEFIAQASLEPLSYGAIGLARVGEPGFTMDVHEAVVGRGEDAFERARKALAGWAHFDLGWVQLFPKRAPAVPETTVAVLIRHLGFWSLNGARVVYTLENSATEFGFAYGTLASHAECGEEIFSVAYQPRTRDVVYRVRAASRPNAILARAGYPITRRLQARFRNDSTAAVARWVG
jgi:uncharacterized protein (UPF0548 family)